jgi:hypothetical protein
VRESERTFGLHYKRGKEEKEGRKDCRVLKREMVND